MGSKEGGLLFLLAMAHNFPPRMKGMSVLLASVPDHTPHQEVAGILGGFWILEFRSALCIMFGLALKGEQLTRTPLHQQS